MCANRTVRGMIGRMVPEAPLEQTEHGLAPKGEGWFVLNAREASWRSAEGRGAVSDFEGETARRFGMPEIHGH